MKKLLGMTALLFGAGMSAAAAADLLPTHKAPAAPPLSAFSWTGCYAGLNAGAVSSSSNFSGLGTASDTSARIAGQAGCNYQFNSFVVGAEGELAYRFNRRQTSGVIPNVALRAGYAFDRALLFGKVGASFTQAKYGIVTNQNVTEIASQQRTGLLLGGGLEYAIDPHWSVKGEGDYINYGSRNVSFTGPTPATIKIGTTQVLGDIGLNYHF